jgi:DNA-binding NarL/FixJ family response regulator
VIGRIVAYVSDIMFAARIEATLEQRGYEVYVVEELPALAAELEAGAKLCLLDLHAGASAADVVALCKPRGVAVVAFGRHTEAALLREARAAGCATVLPRSEFFEKLTSLVEEELEKATNL